MPGKLDNSWSTTIMKNITNKLCAKHPKYRGKRKPKYECEGCLELYLMCNNKPRVLPMPTNCLLYTSPSPRD